MFITKMQRIKSERERRKTQNNLYRFFPQTGSSSVPLALLRRAH